MNTRKSFRTLRIVSQILLTCLVAAPTLSSAAIINISSEQLDVNLQAADQTYTYTGSAFTAPKGNDIWGEILLPNYNPDEPVPAAFLSMFWWNTYQMDNGLQFMGDANTDRALWGATGDYDPYTNIYASSVVSFNMFFTVEGDGASLFSRIMYNASITIMDLTTGTLFSGDKLGLLSGHQYHVSARTQSVNGIGTEQIFWLDFLNAQFNTPEPQLMALNAPEASPMARNIPEPSAMALMIAGLAGLGFAGRKRRRME